MKLPLINRTLPFCLLVIFSAGRLSADWPQFRGPDGQGHSDQEGVPTITNLRNVIHGDEHVLARSNFNLDDEGMTWDYQAKHGLYSKFKWSGS